MADFTADFEAGSNGNTITTGAGEASATAWWVVNGTPVYDTAHVAHGSLAAKLPSANSVDLAWDTVTDGYGRLYLWASAWPGADSHLVYNSSCWTLKVLSSGKLAWFDTVATSGESTATIALNQFIRIEWKVLYSATVGQIEVKLFNTANSTSPTETLTSSANLNTGSGGQYLSFRNGPGVWGSDIWLDDLVANATSYPGPVAGPAVSYTILNGSDEALSNVNAGGTDIDAASYKDGVSLTEEELATLLDGTSFGKKNVAVLPDLTGVADARQIKKTTFSAETESA